MSSAVCRAHFFAKIPLVFCISTLQFCEFSEKSGLIHQLNQNKILVILKVLYLCLVLSKFRWRLLIFYVAVFSGAFAPYRTGICSQNLEETNRMMK